MTQLEQGPGRTSCVMTEGREPKSPVHGAHAAASVATALVRGAGAPGLGPAEAVNRCTCAAVSGEWVELDDRCDWCLAGLPDTTREREE